MSPALAKTCPACQTRNKPKWEFCVRCGESLAGVPATGEGGKAAGKPTAKAAAAAPAGARRSSSSPLGTLAAVVVLGAALVAALIWFFRAPAPQQQRSLLALPRQDATPAPVAPVTKRPGEASFEEAQRRVAQGDLQGAVPFFVRDLAEAPDNVTFRMAYVSCLERLGNTEAAITELRAGMERTSANIEVARTLGDLLIKAGRNDEAVTAYDQALKLQPGDIGSLKGIVTLLVNANRHEQALPYLRQLVEKNPIDLIPRQQLGEALMATGKPAEAAAEFYKIVQSMPNAGLSRVWLAEAQARQGFTDAAVETVRAGLARDPNLPLYHRTLGAMLEKAGKAKEAAAAYRKYGELAPNADDAKEIQARADRLDPPGGPSS